MIHKSSSVSWLGGKKKTEVKINDKINLEKKNGYLQ
jgi:hypothetical protein